MSTKKAYFNFKSPRGAAVYPKLDKPYTYDKAKKRSVADPDGKFEVSIAMTADEADPFVRAITAWATEQGVKVGKLKNMPWKNEEDKAGEETGRIIFKFKQYGKNKDESPKRIGHFDVKGKPLSKDFRLTSGSVIKVAGAASLYKELGGGISLSVDAVQVIEYKEYEGRNPFEDEGEGFTGGDADDDNSSFDNESDTGEEEENQGPTDF